MDLEESLGVFINWMPASLEVLMAYFLHCTNNSAQESYNFLFSYISNCYLFFLLSKSKKK